MAAKTRRAAANVRSGSKADISIALVVAPGRPSAIGKKRTGARPGMNGQAASGSYSHRACRYALSEAGTRQLPQLVRQIRANQVRGFGKLPGGSLDSLPALYISAGVVLGAPSASSALECRQLRWTYAPVTALLGTIWKWKCGVSCPLKTPLFWNVSIPRGRNAFTSASATLLAEIMMVAHSWSDKSRIVATCRRVMTQHWPTSNCHGLITVSVCLLSSMIAHLLRDRPCLHKCRTDLLPEARSLLSPISRVFTRPVDRPNHTTGLSRKRVRHCRRPCYCFDVRYRPGADVRCLKLAGLQAIRTGASCSTRALLPPPGHPPPHRSPTLQVRLHRQRFRHRHATQ